MDAQSKRCIKVEMHRELVDEMIEMRDDVYRGLSEIEWLEDRVFYLENILEENGVDLSALKTIRNKALLRKELRDYEEVTVMTDEERAELHAWVENGYSVHEDPCYIMCGAEPPRDFLDYYRQEEAEKQAFEQLDDRGKTEYFLHEHGVRTDETGLEDELNYLQSDPENFLTLKLQLFVYSEVLDRHGYYNEAQNKLHEIQKKLGIDYDDEELPF